MRFGLRWPASRRSMVVGKAASRVSIRQIGIQDDVEAASPRSQSPVIHSTGRTSREPGTCSGPMTTSSANAISCGEWGCRAVMKTCLGYARFCCDCRLGYRRRAGAVAVPALSRRSADDFGNKREREGDHADVRTYSHLSVPLSFDGPSFRTGCLEHC